eukprot:scaffold2923_cov313-Pinguiococcus_pyrenoidosus.AAC.3
MQKRVEEAAILVIRDSPAVVALANGVAQRLPRDLVVVVKEELELLHADLEVALIEPIRDVPPERTVQAPLLDDRVEEAQAVQDVPELRALRALGVKLLVGDGIRLEGADQVGAQALRRLDRHLHSILKNCHREHLAGGRCTPQPELLMRALWVHLLDDALQAIHPRRRQAVMVWIAREHKTQTSVSAR